MTQRVFLSLLLGWCYPSISAQNLVANPSLEQLLPEGVSVACEFSQYSYDFPRKVAAWTGFYGGTPDLLRAAENCDWFQQVHSGEQCAGIITYLPAEDTGQRTDFHEFIQAKFIAPLKPGQKYILECWVLMDSMVAKTHLQKVYGLKTKIQPLQAGNLGFCFSVLPFPERAISTSTVAINHIKPQVNFAEPIASQGKWVLLQTTFVPDQPFQHVTMGNFFADKGTPTDLPSATHTLIQLNNAAIAAPIDRTKRVSYLCMDDLSIRLESPPPPPKSLEQALLKDKKYTFSAGILFDSGIDTLRTEASVELDELVAFLKKYPQTVIGISGHTDDVGTDEYNLELSERRAKAVQNYLEIKGIRADRLRAKGFGETRPIAENSNPEGRQTNRRVDCVVLK